jgi:hypothetical protein
MNQKVGSDLKFIDIVPTFDSNRRTLGSQKWRRIVFQHSKPLRAEQVLVILAIKNNRPFIVDDIRFAQISLQVKREPMRNCLFVCDAKWPNQVFEPGLPHAEQLTTINTVVEASDCRLNRRN